MLILLPLLLLISLYTTHIAPPSAGGLQRQNCRFQKTVLQYGNPEMTLITGTEIQLSIIIYKKVDLGGGGKTNIYIYIYI